MDWNKRWLLRGIILYITLCGMVLYAWGHDYQHPDQDQWYQQLRMPDSPSTPCCGKGDAFIADRVDECGAYDAVITAFGGSAPDCFMVAIITDTRTVPGRPSLAPGTRIAIPKYKIRKHPSENPTDHNIIFVNPTTRQVYCWEPTALL